MIHTLRRAIRAALMVSALAAARIAPLAAQTTAEGADGRTVSSADTVHQHRTLFTYRDAALAGAFVGLTFAMLPADERIAARLQNPSNQANHFFDKSATGVEYISSPGAYVIGAGLYAVGRLTHQKDIADLGWHGTEAVLLSSGVTNLLKGTLGRSRPFVTNDLDSRDFKFGGGFGSSERQSFPSGHTTTAFAAAAAVTSEVHRFNSRAAWVVGPALYGGASLVGLSRMYHNKHWASDVVLGAAIGTFSGLKVVRYSHAHPDNRLDRLMLSASVMPDLNGGATLAFRLPTH